VLVALNFSAARLDLDFSRTKEIKGRELNIVFSSDEWSVMVKSPRLLEMAPFEAFIAEGRSQMEPGMEMGK
jgi:hypothetical protein